MRVVKSQLTHCLDLLSVMASNAQGMSLTDLALNLRVPKSSTQRLLEHLSGEGWIEQDEATSHYRLTTRLAVLGHRYLESAGITNIAQGLLDRLAKQTGELARLTALDGKRLVWMGSAQGAPPGLRYEPSMGTTIISYATGNGKVWLATLTNDEAVAVATTDGLGKSKARGLLGPNALRSTAALIDDLDVTRKRGFAISNEEAERGVAAVAVAVCEPNGSAVLGTTSVAGPVVRITRERHESIVRALNSTTADLALGWPGTRLTAQNGKKIDGGRGGYMNGGGIDIRGIRKVFGLDPGGVVALENIDLSIKPGEFVSVVGPSGCGKSTLLRIIGGLTPATAGSVAVFGNPVRGPVTQCGIVFQQPILLEWRTIVQNVLFNIDMRGLDVKAYRPRAMKLLAAVGLADFANNRPYELSGGMKQRAAIARALVHEPPLLMMDEPFGALDALTREQMRLDLERIWLDTKKTVFFITHSIDEAVLLSDRVVVMSPRPGRIETILNIDLPRPRGFAARESAGFTEATKTVTNIFLARGVLNQSPA
jgi:NitT/TauT family transport system ATP-binding protein